MDKKQLEAKIKETAGKILAFDISARNEENAEFITLRTKIADYILRWAELEFSKYWLPNATTEIMDCVKLSLTAFHGNAENYIKYIKKVLKKKVLEAKIKETAEKILVFDISARNEENAEFITLRTKIARDIWRWAALVYSKYRLQNATIEIMNCVKLSLTAFHGKAEDYIKYISAALKQEIGRANYRNTDFEQNIIELPEQKKRIIIKILQDAQEYGKDIEQTEIQQKLAGMFDCEEKEIAELVALYFQSKVQSENAVSSNGDKFLLLDSAAALEANRYKKPDEEVISQFEQNEIISKINNFLFDIDKLFCTKSQDRTKPYLSALLLQQVLSDLKNCVKIDNKHISNLLKNRDFAQTEKAQNILERFLSNDELPTQKEVAAMFRRDKTDASRTINKFKEKLKALEYSE